MAEEKLKIVVETEGSQETVDQLNQVSDAVGETTEAVQDNAAAMNNAKTATTGLKSSLGSMFQGLESGISKLNAALGVIGFLVTAVQAAIRVFSQMKEGFDNLSNSLLNFRGDITNAESRLNGFVDHVELMNAQTEIARLGLNLTAEEFGNLSVAAANYSRESGQSFIDSMRELSNAIKEGNIPVLRQYGIQVDETIDSELQLIDARRELNEVFGNNIALTEDATTAAEQNAAAEERFYEMQLRSMDARTRAAHDMEIQAEASRILAEANAESWQKLVDMDFSGFISSLGRATSSAAQLEARTRAIRRLQVEIDGWEDSQTQATPEEAMANLLAGPQAELNARAQSQIGVIPQGGPGTIPEEESGGGGGESEAEKAQRRLNELIAQATTNRNADIATQALALVQEQERIVLAKELLLIQEDQTNIQKEYEASIARENIARQESLENERAMMEFRVREAEDQQRVRDEAEADRAANMAKVEEGFKQTSMFAINAAKVAIKAEGDKKKAVKIFLKDWLKGFAQQMGMKAIEKTAEGIGELPSPTAGFKFASAAAFAALAAAAGGGAKAINTGGGGGGKGQAGKQEASKMPGGAPGDGEGGGGRPPITINITAPVYSTQADVGNAIKQSVKAYDTRYG